MAKRKKFATVCPCSNLIFERITQGQQGGVQPKAAGVQAGQGRFHQHLREGCRHVEKVAGEALLLVTPPVLLGNI